MSLRARASTILMAIMLLSCTGGVAPVPLPTSPEESP